MHKLAKFPSFFEFNLGNGRPPYPGHFLSKTASSVVIDIRDSRDPDKKMPYAQFERIINLAKDDPASFAYRKYGIEVLAAIPVGVMDTADLFVVKRLPVAINQVAIKREKFNQMIVRMEAYGHDENEVRFQPG